MIRPLLLLLIVLTAKFSTAQTAVPNYYWLKFSDKQGTQYTTDRPEEFLSARALARRQKEHIAIDELDLPVSQVYLDSLKIYGAQIFHASKWLNGATIRATPEIYQAILAHCHFIVDSQLTKPGLQTKSVLENKFRKEQLLADSMSYGDSFGQLSLFNGQYLHNQNYLGDGVLIAVLDAGFYHADRLPAFSYLWADHRILGTRDFVDPPDNIFEQHYHGAWVLSTMAGEVDGQLIGTAPKASYYLLRSEDANSEYIIEEDNWVAAAEYADSLGCDIINSSLGYSLFDDSTTNHSYADMNGHTTRVTQAANIAVEKGMLVFASAGNEARDPWHYIIAPSDGDFVVGVAAVNKDSIWAPFSSLGPASDGDV
ncbi:MAG TPA: S8 family serine peptidase, partial [Sunxiuqinia sp.]|nr:S8 family serine peptidase [Sunxiuqinia sp.]